MSESTRNLVIIHTNDIHAAFQPDWNDSIPGGMGKLRGKLNLAAENNQDHILFTVAGDTFTASIIDKEFEGFKSAKLLTKAAGNINTVVTPGNHGADHTFLKLVEYANNPDFAPLISANIYRKGERVFNPYMVFEINGLKIFVIGVVTKEFEKGDELDDELDEVEVRPALEEIRKVCDELDMSQYDVKIILSHLGIQADKELSENLRELSRDPKQAYGFDFIIGGHDHYLVKQEEIEEIQAYNRQHDDYKIPIFQVEQKCRYVGRIDLEVDPLHHKVTEWDWQAIPLDRSIPLDEKMQGTINKLEEAAREKQREREKNQPDGSAVFCHLPRQLDNSYRYAENEVGDFIADVLCACFPEDLDFAMVGSGGLRGNAAGQLKLGPEVTRNDIRTEIMNVRYYQVPLTGAQLKNMLVYFLSKAPDDAEGHGEYYQFSHGCHFAYDRASGTLTKALVNDTEPVEDDKVYRIGVEFYHVKNSQANLGIALDRSVLKVLTNDIKETVIDFLDKHTDAELNLDFPVYEMEKEQRIKRIPEGKKQ